MSRNRTLLVVLVVAALALAIRRWRASGTAEGDPAAPKAESATAAEAE